MELLGLGLGPGAEVLGEERPKARVRRERGGGTARAGQGGQERAQGDLVVGVGLQQLARLVLGGHDVPRAGGHVQQRVAEAPQPLPGRGGLGRGPPRVAFVGQERSPDQGEAGGRGRPGRRQGAPFEAVLGLGGVVGEGIEVEPVDGEPVSGVRALDPAGAQDGAQPADQHGDLVRGAGRRAVAPEALGQAVDADRAAVVQRQDLEQGALLATPQHGHVATLHPEVTQQPDPQALHPSILACRGADRGAAPVGGLRRGAAAACPGRRRPAP